MENECEKEQKEKWIRNENMYKMFAKRCYMVSEPVHGCHLLDESKTFSDTDDPQAPQYLCGFATACIVLSLVYVANYKMTC